MIAGKVNHNKRLIDQRKRNSTLDFIGWRKRNKRFKNINQRKPNNSLVFIDWRKKLISRNTSIKGNKITYSTLLIAENKEIQKKNNCDKRNNNTHTKKEDRRKIDNNIEKFLWLQKKIIILIP